MQEPIEQIEQAQPKGPFKMRWLRNLGAKGMMSAGCLLFVFIWSFTHRLTGPVAAAATKPAPVIEEKKERKQEPPNGLTDNPQKTAPGNPGYGTQGSGASAQPPIDPMKEMQAERRKKLIESAFADNVVKVEAAQQEKAAEQPKQSSEAKAEAVRLNPDRTLPEGTAIAAVLDSRLEGEFTGPVYAHVASDVYVPRTRQLVIPQGAWLLGQAERVGSFGQHRVAVAFHAIKVFSNDQHFCTIDLGKEPGLDQQGAAGMTGKVNNHTASLIATAAVVALIQGASLSIGYQGGGYDPRSQVMSNMTSGTAQVAARILEPHLNRPPTITIPEGTRLNVPLTKDLDVTCKGVGE
ncbi:MAG: TrbI/VirB10 family protein [Bryobacteraceae bacterium]